MLDYLLVGFGLSGACLSYYLEAECKDFIVFEDDSQQASKVAGGLYNPVVLKRFNLAWNAKQQLETAIPFYNSLESMLGVAIKTPVPIHRKFYSVEEQNNWFLARDKPDLENFLSPNLVKQHVHIPAEHQFGEVFPTGRIDTKRLLASFSDYLSRRNKIKKEQFDYNALQIESNFVQYKKLKAKRIVFCEGFGMKQNPFFRYLPLQGNKGEYIIIESPNLKLKEIVKSSVFIIPLGNDRYKVGAGYERNFDNPLPTDVAKEELAHKLEETINCDYTIVDQVAGIRPTVPDRKPLVGQHPKYKNLYLCNGFGSRGVLIGPSLTKQLVDNMETGEPLSPEVDVSRFSKKYDDELI